MSAAALRELKKSAASYAPYVSELKLRLALLIDRKSDNRSELRRGVRLEKFAKLNIRTVFQYYELKILGCAWRRAFPEPNQVDLIECYRIFCNGFEHVTLLAFFTATVEAFVNSVLTPVEVDEINKEEFEDTLWDKFMYGAGKTDGEWFELDGINLRNAEAAMKEFRGHFFSEAYFDKFNRYEEEEDEEGKEDESEDHFDGAWMGYEIDATFDEYVISDDGFDDTFDYFFTSLIEEWKFYKHDGKVVGGEQILLPEGVYNEAFAVDSQTFAERARECLEALQERLMSSAAQGSIL